eukprot:3261985-Amphidinium_carterae.1
MRAGKGYKGRGNRKFEHCVDLVAHLCSFHLGPLQLTQLDMLTEQRMTVRQLVWYFFNHDILDVPFCPESVAMLPDVIPQHPCRQQNPVVRRPPFFINPMNGELGLEAERKGKGKGKAGKGKGKGAPLPYPIGPP